MARLAHRCLTAATMFAALALSTERATANVIRVPADRPTIQQGINAALNGDTVRVAQGLYFENLDFIGKAIVVTSESGPAVTIIDGNQNGSVVRFASGETLSSVLSGFTLQHGSGSFGGGGGIAVESCSPAIRDNVIRECNTGGIGLSNSQGLVERNLVDHNSGPGISIGGGTPVVQDNTVTNNSAGSGGGIDCSFSNARILRNHIHHNNGQFGGGMSVGGDAEPLVEGNVIEENRGGNGGAMELFAAGRPVIRNNVFRNNDGGNEGGALWIVNNSDALIVQNLFVGNHAFHGGGVLWLVPSGARGPRLLNNTFANNSATQGSALFADGFDINAEIVGNVMAGPANQTVLFCGDFNDLNNPQIRFNHVFTPSGPAYGGTIADQTGLNGNISGDPSFRDATRNFRLRSGSICIDTGDDAATDLPATDLDGQPRRFDGNGDGTTRVDMGAYEFGNANLPPVADAGGPYSGDVDDAFHFDGTRSLDPDDDSLTYVWDFGDSTAGTGARVDHKYAHVGSFKVSLTVSDGTHGASDTTVAQALDINSPPIADAGGPYSGLVNQPIQFDGRGSHDPEGDSLTYHWSFGDGATADGPTPTHGYFFSSQFTVILEVRDATGVGLDTTTATVRFALADMVSRQSHTPDPATAGREITYTVSAVNNGPDVANDANLSFSAFGSARRVTKVTTTRDTCTADTSGCCVFCRFGTFNPGDSARVTITVLPLEEGFIGTQIQASSTTPDPDFANNSSFGQVSVLFSAEQRLTALIALVQTYPIKKGQQKTLTDRLQDARTAVTAKDTSAACVSLVDFRQRVGRLAGHGLTITQSLALDTEADLIQNRLGCGGRVALASEEKAGALPTAFAFHLKTTTGASAQAQLALPAATAVRLDVFDVNGRLVRTAHDGLLEAGEHTLAWDGHANESGRAPVGFYFLRVSAGRDIRVSRFVLLR